MLRLSVVILFLFSCYFGTAQNDDEILAEDYFKRGEFKKALVLYKSLHQKKAYNLNYFYKIIESYQQLEAYDKADSFIKERLVSTKFPTLLVELGYNYQLIDSISKAKELYTEAISYLDQKPSYIYSIARKFEDHALLDEAIVAYTKGKELSPDKNFSMQLARIYGDKGDIEKMFSSYMEYIAYRPQYINNTKRALSQFISENPDNESNILLRRSLLKKIQKEPNAYWYEMLSWLYIQEKAYKKAFIQEKALYLRNPESLDRIIELAVTALNDNASGESKRIFNYVLATTQDPEIALTAHQYILEIDTANATPEELITIDQTYNELFDIFGKSELTIPLQLAYAKFLAFSLKDTEKANASLKASLKLNISEFQEAKVKLLLGDILVLQERFNEALIYFTQIQATLKNSTIAQEARYKVAKTSYYKGDFEWAEIQLKILKSSTSQLIANDALDLKLLISDNKWEDSTQTALRYYAKADLLAFQNKPDEAIELLDKVLTEHKGESITDQALFSQAKLYTQKALFEKAEANYQQIIKDYGEDFLADDAHYYLAELYHKQLNKPDEAKALYEKIVFDFEDSIYFIEARKTFRMLRGDAIN